MWRESWLVGRTLAAAGLALACFAESAGAGDLARLIKALGRPLQAVHREPPAAGCDDDVRRVADQIDWLEHHLRAYGSIVAKQPDIWGQSRLTRHRVEYEEELGRELHGFTERTTAALRRSDQAYLGMALALQGAAGRRRGPEFVPVPEATGSTNVINSIQGLLPTTNEPVGRADPVVIARTAPLGFPPNPAGFRFDDEPLALEPTVHLDQLSRYLAHLQQLRRINEGDDSADAPGYSLNLVRIPVSITPGTHTRKGHGAEITLIAEPCLGDGLLPATFRNLVINDLVDVISPALTWCINDPECVAWAATIARPAGPGEPPEGHHGIRAAMQALAARLPTIAPSSAPAVKTRRSRLPLPFSQLADVAGIEQIAILIRETRSALGGHPANRPCIELVDVRGYLAEELEAAHDFLESVAHRHLWAELPGWTLAALVRSRRAAEIATLRCRFLEAVGAADGRPADVALSLEPIGPGACCGEPVLREPTCRTVTAVLAWGILVESALLDDRLTEDMRQAATARGMADPGPVCAGPFFGPEPSPEARAVFNDYVRRRWPIRVFALDPVAEAQNVEESFSRRRETQVAMALAAAGGRLGAQALARYTRRLEADLATVTLNKTAVGFSHGSDTFGWRFYPRIQAPPTRGTLATLTEAVCGGPTTDGDLMQRQLEPGLRECAALVVMPSFVPWVNLDVRTTWFALAHPAATDQTMRTAMELSRAVQALKAGPEGGGRAAECYRAGDVALMMRRVEQLERELPLQSLQAHVPHENTAGGFELFNAGITDLAPELIGWYGAPGIDPANTTSLFLVGKGFSIHDTRVIAGGRPARFTLLSREVLRIDVPPGPQTIVPDPCTAAHAGGGPGLVLAAAAEPLPAPGVRFTDGLPGPVVGGAPDGCVAACPRRELVDIHLATPYGVTGHLLVPVVHRAPAAETSAPAFASTCTLDLTFTPVKTAGSRGETARVDEYFAATCEALVIAVPAAFIPPPKAVLRLLLRDDATGTTAAVFAFADPFFDARNSRYVIGGGDLRNFVGDTSRPATDKTLRGALKPYLDHLLREGLLAADGDQVGLTLTGALLAGQQDVPVAGSTAVRVTRRGATLVEPREDQAAVPP